MERTRDTFRCYYCNRRLDEYLFGEWVLEEKTNATLGKACSDCCHDEKIHTIYPDGKHWAHDCKGCFFLGAYYDDNKPIDVYVCTNGKKRGNVCILLRYGNDGPDYWSMSTFHLGQD